MDWMKILQEYGLPLTGLILFGVAIIKGWLVPGATHEDVKKQRDRAFELVYKMADRVKPEGR
jgi:hypothetical protein